jgi:hypothetical protein
MSQSYIIIFVETVHHVTVGSDFVLGCLLDFEMLCMDVHEQAQLVAAVQVIITNDSNEMWYLRL